MSNGTNYQVTDIRDVVGASEPLQDHVVVRDISAGQNPYNHRVVVRSGWPQVSTRQPLRSGGSVGDAPRCVVVGETASIIKGLFHAQSGGL